MSNPIIPDSFESWKYCITVSCGIKLSPSYINQRISELKDMQDESTKRFISLYGQHHYDNVLGWFEHSRSESINL